MHCFEQLLPPVLRQYDEMHAGEEFDYEEENRYIHENFPSYPNISIDYGILEKSEQVCMMKCNFGWADLGTWHSIYEAMHNFGSRRIHRCRREERAAHLPEGRLVEQHKTTR